MKFLNYLLGLPEAIFSFFYKNDKDDLEEIDWKKYKKDLIKKKKKSELKVLYDKAWETRNFEIELYWKRATYFWAFQVAAFAGYFTVLSSNNLKAAPAIHPQVLYFVICIGFITSIAWVFINLGSKSWQRHWETHVDLLEDYITGPLYKTVAVTKTYSVSKINDIVSRFITTIWVLLGYMYFKRYITFKSSISTDIDEEVIFATIVTFYFLGAMIWGHGRGRFGKRKVTAYRRKVKFK